MGGAASASVAAEVAAAAAAAAVAAPAFPTTRGRLRGKPGAPTRGRPADAAATAAVAMATPAAAVAAAAVAAAAPAVAAAAAATARGSPAANGASAAPAAVPAAALASAAATTAGRGDRGRLRVGDAGSGRGRPSASSLTSRGTLLRPASRGGAASDATGGDVAGTVSRRRRFPTALVSAAAAATALR